MDSTDLIFALKPQIPAPFAAARGVFGSAKTLSQEANIPWNVKAVMNKRSTTITVTAWLNPPHNETRHRP